MLLTLADQIHGHGKLFGSLSLRPELMMQELKARNINHARNLFDRAITLLPRVDAVSPT